MGRHLPSGESCPLARGMACWVEVGSARTAVGPLGSAHAADGDVREGS